MGESLDVARGMKRVGAYRGEIVQRVVAVARALAVEHRTRLPPRVRLPQDLPLAEQRGARVEVVARDIVLRKAVARGVAEAEADRDLVRRQGTGHSPTEIAAVEVAVGAAQAAGPGRERRAPARDVDDAAERVASEQRALRTAHEFNLVDVDQLDARRVRVELRHAVDVARDAGIGRAGADAAKACVAQLPGAEFVEERVWGKAGGVADGADCVVVQRGARHGGHADGKRLRIGRLLLRRHRDRRYSESDRRLRSSVRRREQYEQAEGAGEPSEREHPRILP